MYFYTNLLTLHVATCMYFDIIYYMHNYIGYTYMYMYMYSAENVHVHVHNVKRFSKEHKHTYTSKLKLPSLGKGRNERSSDRYFRKGSSYPQIISSTLRVMNRFSEISSFKVVFNSFMISSISFFAISGRFSTIFCNFCNWTRRP